MPIKPSTTSIISAAMASRKAVSSLSKFTLMISITNSVNGTLVNNILRVRIRGTSSEHSVAF